MSARQLFDEACKLSAEERLELAADIWESLDAREVPVTAAQRAELRQRLTYYDSHPEEQGSTLAEIKKRLGVG